MGNISEGESENLEYPSKKEVKFVATNKVENLQQGEMIRIENKNNIMRIGHSIQPPKYAGIGLDARQYPTDLFKRENKEADIGTNSKVKILSFCGELIVRVPLFGYEKNTFSFESSLFKSMFLRHKNSDLYFEQKVDDQSFRQSATWKIEKYKGENETDNSYCFIPITNPDKRIWLPDKAFGEERYGYHRPTYLNNRCTLKDDGLPIKIMRHKDLEDRASLPFPRRKNVSTYSEFPFTDGDVVSFENAILRNHKIVYNDKNEATEVMRLEGGIVIDDFYNMYGMHRINYKTKFIVREGVSKKFKGFSFECLDRKGLFLVIHRFQLQIMDINNPKKNEEDELDLDQIMHELGIEEEEEDEGEKKMDDKEPIAEEQFDPKFEELKEEVRDSATFAIRWGDLYTDLCKKISVVKYPLHFIFPRMSILEKNKPTGGIRVSNEKENDLLMYWMIRRDHRNNPQSQVRMDEKERMESLIEFCGEEEENCFDVILDNKRLETLKFCMCL